MADIIKFKTKDEQFGEWINKVVNTNFQSSTPSNCIIMWQNKKDNGETTASLARFNCLPTELKDYKYYLDEAVLEAAVVDIVRKNFIKD